MMYGGLRGAVAFALVLLIDPKVCFHSSQWAHNWVNPSLKKHFFLPWVHEISYHDFYYKISWKHWCMKIWMLFQKRFHPTALRVESICFFYQNSNDYFLRIHEESYYLEVCCHLFLKNWLHLSWKTTCHQNPYKMAAEFFKNSTKILFGKADGISSIYSIYAKLIP